MFIKAFIKDYDNLYYKGEETWLNTNYIVNMYSDKTTKTVSLDNFDNLCDKHKDIFRSKMRTDCDPLGGLGSLDFSRDSKNILYSLEFWSAVVVDIRGNQYVLEVFDPTTREDADKMIESLAIGVK